MIWSKNKKGKKAGTTLIGISFGNEAALGTDFDSTKSDGEEISIVEEASGALIGYTGPKGLAGIVDLLKKNIEETNDIGRAAETTAASWNPDKKIAKDSYLVVLDGRESYTIEPGTARLQKAGLVAVGPGQEYALAAVRAILAQPKIEETAYEIVKKAFDVASSVCVLVNSGARIIVLGEKKGSDG
ncbi:hypothetical protein J7L01_00945 [bacterium]|nr:hypothetical protein [bacterium]